MTSPPSADPRPALGRLGERLAQRHLQRQGFTILETRYRRRSGEVDLIASRQRLLVFVEVKTRRAPVWIRAAAAVGPIKRRRMARIAADYLARHAAGSPVEPACRFDVIEVLVDEAGHPQLSHIEDAFRIWPRG